MNPEDRKNMRLELLKEIYDYHFDNKAETFRIITRDDFEKASAIRYLISKNWITDKSSYDEHIISITFEGMDRVESM